MWSSYVDPEQFVTPVDAIAAAAGSGNQVAFARGSLGDVTLPSLASDAGMFAPPISLVTPDGKPGC